jgi:DNA-binding transcriptional ArsR family regulator
MIGLLVSKKKVKHLIDEPTSYYERRLMREIELLEARIGELREEQKALKRQLIKARWENHALRDVSRINSANRVMVEDRILGELRDAERPIANAKLFASARNAIFDLKQTTFRTYISRLKYKGLIESPQRGFWCLVKSEKLDR